MAQRPCPKCQASMQEGWVLDNTHGGRAIATWVEGEPQKSIWVGVKLEGKKPIEDINYAFGTIKWWVAEAYYTSQLGIHDELNYQGNIYIDEFAGADVTPIDRT